MCKSIDRKKLANRRSTTADDVANTVALFQGHDYAEIVAVGPFAVQLF